MKEKKEIYGKFINIKLISVLIFIVGIVLGITVFILTTNNLKEDWVDSQSYSFDVPYTNETIYHSGAEINEMSFFEFVRSEYMDSDPIIISIVIIVIVVIITVVIYALYFNMKIAISDKGVNGKSVFGKNVVLDYSQIEKVKKSFLKGVTITTIGESKIKFRLLSNQEEIIAAIKTKIR